MLRYLALWLAVRAGRWLPPRALYALAVGWIMESKPPDRLDFKAGQLFAFDQRDGLRLQRLNVTLNGRPA